MTKAFPNVIIKKEDEPQDMGYKGGPVKPITKSWRERSGKRRTFGAPEGGWPRFDKEGKIVKRKTDPGPTDMQMPKGYAGVCFKCAKDAELDEEFTITANAHTVGTCSFCGEKNVGLMGIEEARYQALLDRNYDGGSA